MTELVTLNAAREAQQLAVLAQRQDVAPREHHQPTIQIGQAGVDPDVGRGPQQAEAGAQGDSSYDTGARRDRQDLGLTGPSRPRVEIRTFDPGPKDDAPASGNTNIVPDVTIGSTGGQTPQPVVVTGVGSSPANSLAASPVLNGRTQAEVEVAIAQQAVQTAAFAQTNGAEADLRAVRLEAAARAVRANAATQFGSGLSPEIAQQKFSDKAAAAEGFGDGSAPVQEKYYGKGSEAVLGRFALPDQPQKYSERAGAAQDGVTFEDGSGEAKYYDKVAQTESEFAGNGGQDDSRSMYDRAQEFSDALSEGTPGANEPRKYADAPSYGAAKDKTTVSVTVQGQPVTIQVTA